MLDSASGKRELAEVVPDHLGHDLDLLEAHAVIYLDALPHHLRQDYHIPKMGPDGLLASKISQELLVLLGDASLYRSALPRWKQLGKLLYAQLGEVGNLPAPVQELFLPLGKLGSCFLSQNHHLT